MEMASIDYKHHKQIKDQQKNPTFDFGRFIFTHASHLSFSSERPKTGGLDLWFSWIYKKSVGIHLVVRPTLRGSGIAQIVKR